MYRLGKRKRRSRQLYIYSGVLLFFILVAGASYAYTRSIAKNNTAVKNGAASVRYVGTSSSQKSHFDEGIFSLDLPPAWKLVNHQVPPASLYNVYTFQGTTGEESSRIVAVYQDLLPATMAVNHEVSVQPQGGSMSHGVVSDNCLSFASDASRSTAEAIKQQVAALRWDGVDFLCDLGNYNRNVTGIGSQGNINKVTLTGTKSGAHSFFIVYTDANIEPDYSILYDMLDSFKLK